MNDTEKRLKFREIMKREQVTRPASIHDAISANIADHYQFELGMFAGSIASATVLGAPDYILLTMNEFADQIRKITRYSKLAVLADADHGYGNAMNISRTTEELENAGISAFTIEDTQLPLPFDAVNQNKLIDSNEMVGKLNAALKTRQDKSMSIIARTSAINLVGIDEAIARVKKYSELDKDGIFLTGVNSEETLVEISSVTDHPLILGSAPSFEKLSEEDLAKKYNVKIILAGHAHFYATMKSLYESYGKQASGKYSEIEVLDQSKVDLFIRKQYYDNITKELM